MFQRKTTSMTLVATLLAALFLITSAMIAPGTADACHQQDGYHFWKTVGSRAAVKVMWMMRKQGIRVHGGDCIVLSNAGYAEVNASATTGALDGLSFFLGASRGDHSLVEIQSAPEAALWFAVYHRKSGYCAYLQIDPDAIGKPGNGHVFGKKPLFAVTALERVNADHLFQNAEIYAEKFNSKVFGGNEFRIVTIANAIAAGAPTAAVRAFEFHDHYCPGVTSGIMMALYVKAFYPLAPGGSYFVQTVQPWCKEDALLVLLNATPGKKKYAITYPTEEDIASWPEHLRDAATIVYRKDPATGSWDGMVLGYKGGDTGCPDYGHSVMNKLCSDLWYLANMDHPEEFIHVLYEFELPDGVNPLEYARPGVDPIKAIGLLK